jgi:hypothetical protein
MDRREFSKMVGLAGVSALVNSSCSNQHTPLDHNSSLLTDKIQWTFPIANPVIKPGQLNPDYDNQRAGAAHVLQYADKFRMYYWASSPEKGNSICIAETPVDQLNQWKGIGPALQKQPDIDYNHYGPGFPFVIPVDEKHWLMYFCGWGKKRADGVISNRTALTESFDSGITWKYYDKNPLIPLDKKYDQAATGSCWVVRADNEFRMYYTAISKYFPKPQDVRTGHDDRIPLIGIAYMTSPDGCTWTKPLNDFLIKPRLHETEPFNYIVSKPCVVREPNGWRMWVSTFGTAYRIRSLVSADGLHWTWIPSGIDGDLGTGKPNEFDSHQRSYLCVIKHQNQYHGWYTGNRFGAQGMGYTVGILT